MKAKRVSNSSERIKELMQIYNLKQIDIANRTGICRSVISYYVSGRREPMQNNLYIISSTFNIDPAWLMGFDVPMIPKKKSERETEMEYIYQTENAELLVEVQSSKEDMEMLRKYARLTAYQKALVSNMIDGLLGKQ